MISRAGRQAPARSGSALAAGRTLLLGLLWLAAQPAAADRATEADAVVVADTSTSMSEPGMDPERTSLLVTKLLADISPGSLAVVRLLDVRLDSDLLPSRATDKVAPCLEDTAQECAVVEAATDWAADARHRELGAIRRPARGDEAFKRQLESHLAQRIHNSLFHLALRAAQGVLEQRRQEWASGETRPQAVVWLSDGRSEDEAAVAAAVADLQAENVAVEAIVFGRGDTRLARQLGLRTHQVRTPADLMKAFAGAFRRIVQAPYELDSALSGTSTFEMQRGVDEAWIVVYGDDTLSRAEVAGPSGVVPADHAADRWPGAGAYRVAHLGRPAAGSWTVRAVGGGPEAAYAVVQRSALSARLLAPEQAVSGLATTLVATVVAESTIEPIRDPDALAQAELSVEVEGDLVPLRDDGRNGDEVAGDGRFSGIATLHGFGSRTVHLRLRTPLVDRTTTATVRVSGRFTTRGEPVEVDLGRLGPASEACRPLRFRVEHEGQVPLALELLRPPPSGHGLSVRTPEGYLEANQGPTLVAAGDSLEVCLSTSARAPSSGARGEPWLALGVVASDDPHQRQVVRLRWRVDGLGFWARWGWLVLLLLAALAVVLLVGGYVVPQRFPPALALVYVPDRDELDEQIPQPVRQWRGVGIRFYRNARAYLRPDYRLSGHSRSALAMLAAVRGGTRVVPAAGAILYREALDGSWEPVAAAGHTARHGDVFRVGERGPFFRLTSARGRA